MKRVKGILEKWEKGWSCPKCGQPILKGQFICQNVDKDDGYLINITHVACMGRSVN